MTVLKKTNLTRLESEVLSLVKHCSIPYSLEPSPKSLIFCTKSLVMEDPKNHSFIGCSEALRIFVGVVGVLVGVLVVEVVVGWGGLDPFWSSA